ncbi:beta keto-acyl synthase [Amycolatopsis sp. EV170708-02-1]|nr:beta-ketoacyl synthase N-terminal-like domain-containing protein [Amycolatopsis sp. EV170708-02-1]UMP06728.1 beta keto-acyl synthase [Amycolatopsis sp. EV170708-02-1]
MLPDALTPGAWWDNLARSRDSLRPAPAGHWRLPASAVIGTPTESGDRAWSDKGGYVDGFGAVFDPDDYDLDATLIGDLDPLFQWVLHCGRQALGQAGRQGPEPDAGLVLGNLSFPSASMAAYAENVWLDTLPEAARDALVRTGTRPDPHNRFCSGLPAHLAATALGLGRGGFSLDAACASSLYAIKLACDRLHDHTAGLMLAGGVNRADDLFLHMGFSALSAMSRTGRSRPFHRGADGLVPAEGAALFALMRLTDASAAGTPILGVIRGIGLSNDGRSGGFLVPALDGQIRAMEQAYRLAGLAPETVSLVECHATGTPVGDAAEAQAMAKVFGAARDLPIGSAKSNVGHLITAAGGAGLLKVLGALRTGIRPATLHTEEPIDALRGTALRLLTEPEEWSGPRRAAVSAFGFGGNNAHMIVEAWDGARTAPGAPFVAAADPVAIVAVAVRAGDGDDTADFVASLLHSAPCRRRRDTVTSEMTGLRFPPADLREAHSQQSLLLDVVREATRGISLARDRTIVLAGMGCDPEVARHGARWRIASLLAEAGIVADPAQLAEFRAAFAPPLSAATVVGTMPNIIANRLNAQLDLTGPSFAVSAEEASGTVALSLAARAIRAGEADAAIVAAVDLSDEPVHRKALAELGRDVDTGDAAVALVLKPLRAARRDGDDVIAVLATPDTKDTRATKLVVGASGFDPAGLFGSAHAAEGLLAVAVGALALRHRALPRSGHPADPALGLRAADVLVTPLAAPESRVQMLAGAAVGTLAAPPPRMYVYAGADVDGVLAALTEGRESREGPARLVILAADAEEHAHRAAATRRWLTAGAPKPPGVAFRERPLPGEVAFVFTGGMAAYPRMGRELMMAFPTLVDSVEPRPGWLQEHIGWAYTGSDGGAPRALDQIWGTALLSQLHATITRTVLGLRPTATIGYSAGETNALVAMGVWTDLPELVAQINRSTLFTQDLAGDFAAIRRVWTRDGITGEPWANYLVGTSAARVRAALAGEPGVHLVTINAPDSCVIGGDAVGCERVLARLDGVNALHLPYRLAAHVPEVGEVRAEWRRLHHRSTDPAPGVRLYSCATADSYTPTTDAVADALTAQAVSTMDFAATVERAWEDGVRVFVEHGPQGLCTRWIKSTLGDRDHLAVALDPGDGRDADQLMQVAAELVAANVDVDAEALYERLSACVPSREQAGRRLTLPAHPPLVRLPDLAQADQVMPPAPPLAPVHPREPARSSAALATSRPDGTRAAAVNRLSRLAAVHRDFIERQAEVHQKYLEVHKNLLSVARRGTESPNTVPAAAPVSTTPGQPEPTRDNHRRGPEFDRAQLELHASGRISALFGPAFAEQDGYERQTRMPQPPMLLADRVTGIDADPGSMGTGTIWTETDVRADSWYLDHTGRMPTGLLVEAGQADLLLISWLGVDLLNRGQRVYRLLGCEMSFHGSPPRPGETLRYEVHIDGHAEHDGARLFFFHYDCFVGDELRLTMRNGQAGFFTDAELAASTGLLWTPDDDPPTAEEKTGDPAGPADSARFDAAAVRAFAGGRPADCFGPAWRATEAHVRTPRIADGRMLLLGEITAFDPSGGWGTGYLRAETMVRADDWFFAGHFQNDPCMPGTLMLEGCLQAMAFYLAAAGCTIERDGWRFEPVPGTAYPMRCRGQVTPDSRCLGYEVFVAGFSMSPYPTVYADVLCTVDGIKAFHARRLGLRLVPDWPLDHWRHLGPPATQNSGQLVPLPVLGGLAGHADRGVVAEQNGFAYGYAALLACAWGRSTDAFGPAYARFDGPRRMPRLPGPPYHFITRITAVDEKPGTMLPGGHVEAEYDLPEDAWYLRDKDATTMPLAVLMEIGLQPCGWLATYVGCPLSVDTDLLFRNLDGTMTIGDEIPAGARTVRTRAHLRDISQTSEMILVFFDVECLIDEVQVLAMSTSFGFFPPAAFADQSGLPVLAEDRVALAAPGEQVDLTDRRDRDGAGKPRPAGQMLLMLDRITGYWPDGGRAGLGRARAEKDVDAGEWFFKAHFFTDPVQPGSLGIEAMYQLLQWCVLERGTHASNPRFTPMLDRPIEWKYRGQVLPTNDRITIELEITDAGSDSRGEYAIAEAWLWVDGTRIYHARGLGIRVLAGSPSGSAAVPPQATEVIDPAAESWLADHCPTFTVPALPMASMVDRLAHAALTHRGRPIAGLRDVQVRRWLPLPGAVRAEYRVDGVDDDISVTMLAWREARTAAMSRFEPVVTGRVLLGDPPRRRPAMFESLSDAVAIPDPYESGRLFQGPALRYLTSLRVGTTGASGVLDPANGSAPHGELHQGLLDGALQVVPSDRLWLWSPDIPQGVAAFPHGLVALDLYQPLPDAAEIRVEARFAGFRADQAKVSIGIQLIADEQVCVAMDSVWALLPIGRLALVAPGDRRAFLRDRAAVPGAGLSAQEGGCTRLARRDVEWCDWLAGTVAHVYGLAPGARGIDHMVEIAVQDHVAARAGVHPSEVRVAPDHRTAYPANRPSETYRLCVEEGLDCVLVSDDSQQLSGGPAEGRISTI